MHDIYICDDDFSFAIDLQRRIESLFPFQFNISLFKDGAEIVQELENNPLAADIIFLDIVMPIVHGLDVGKRVRNWNDQVPIILVTDYNDFVCDGYEFNALKYLMKPIDTVELKRTLESALCRVSQSKPNEFYHFYNRDNRLELVSIRVKNILYIQSQERIKHFYTTHGTYSTYRDLAELKRVFEPLGFVHVDNRVFVNKAHIEAINYKQHIVELSDGSQISISRNKRNSVYKTMQE